MSTLLIPRQPEEASGNVTPTATGVPQQEVVGLETLQEMAGRILMWGGRWESNPRQRQTTDLIDTVGNLRHSNYMLGEQLISEISS